MKKLLLVLMVGISVSAFAGEFQPLREKKVKDFPALKEDVIKSINVREEVLRNERKCVEAAQSEKDLRVCFKGAKEERKKISEIIRPQTK